MPRTLFVYQRGGIDTAEIRGRQIACRLAADAASLRTWDPETARKYDLVVYVKKLPPARVLSRVHNLGVRQVFDILDNYSAWKTRGRFGYLDAVIAANLTQRLYVEDKWSVRSVEIPHHHCNFDSLRIPVRSSAPVLGFISTPANRQLNERLAKAAGYRCICNVSRKGEQGLGDLVKSYLATDIGFAWRMDNDKLRFNCANKLTNFMSFGIPSVLTPESGYLQYGRHGETVLLAHNRDDFVRMLRWLGGDDQVRRRMGDACYEAAQPFHIDRIKLKYQEFLQSL